MSNTKKDGAEKELERFCLDYFKRQSSILKTFDLQCDAGLKVLGDVTCIKEKNEPYQMVCSLAEVDLAFHIAVSPDTKDIRKIPFFKFVQVPSGKEGEVVIPFLIVELKRGPITSDAIRARNAVAQKIKYLFPFCFYVFLGDETTKTTASAWQHGKNFNDYFLYSDKITREQLKKIEELCILPHLQKLLQLGLISKRAG
jgi:hypothetical protein